MSIIDRNTVLILGAGVSKPFGIPLGGELIDAVRKQIVSELDRFSDFRTRIGAVDGFLTAKATSVNDFFEYPIIGAIAKKNYLEKGVFNSEGLQRDFDQLQRIAVLLNGQTSETIDDFIIQNQSVAEITKIAIAAIFMTKCYKKSDDNWVIQDFENRHFPTELSDGSNRNWIHLLINIIRQGFRFRKPSDDRKIRIVTFNYDKILEYVLSKQFKNTEISLEDYDRYIEIIHVHGACGDLKEIPASPAQDCIDWASGIHVVNSTVMTKSVMEARDLAKSYVRNAREIYICGFSFAGPNCKLIELDNPDISVQQRKIYYCNFDGNIGIEKIASKLKTDPLPRFDGVFSDVKTEVEPTTGSPDKLIGVNTWVKIGSLGEMPG